MLYISHNPPQKTAHFSRISVLSEIASDLSEILTRYSFGDCRPLHQDQ